MLKSRLLGAVGIVVVFGPVLIAQAPTKPLAFEVASIKRNMTGDDNASIRAQPGGRVVVTNNSIRNLIRNIYDLQNFQVVDGPSWVDTDRWDIVAKAEQDEPVAQLAMMLRTLLQERFKLVLRRETRDLPTYELVVARDGRLGANLHASSLDCSAINAARAQGVSDGRAVCGVRAVPGSLTLSARTMGDFAGTLSSVLGRVVTDRTGLTGSFDLDLKWTADAVASANGSDAASLDAGSLFTAVEEQLGLKLVASRGPVDVLVIDHVEHPTEN